MRYQTENKGVKGGGSGSCCRPGQLDRRSSFPARQRRKRINHCRSPWAGRKCQVCSHPHDRSEMQEGAGTGKAKGLAAGSQKSRSNGGGGRTWGGNTI